MKKWANVRDSFQRSERKYKTSLQSSGSARQPPKTYIYGKQLQFLKKTTEGRPTDDSFSDDARAPQPPKHSENDGDETNPNEGLNKETAEEVLTFKKPNQIIKKKRKPDPVELELISVIKQKPDRHSSFFNGIIPSLETFDDDEIVEFQLKVLQVVSEIKKRKKASADINPAIHPSTSHEWHSSHDQRYHILQPPSTAAQFYEREGQDFMGTAFNSPIESDVSETSSMDSLNF